MERKAQQTAGDDKDLDVLVHPVTRTESLDYSKPEANLPGKISDDDVEAFIARHGGVQTYTEESNRKLIRRIDLHIMPLMCVSYCLQVKLFALSGEQQLTSSMSTRALWLMLLSLASVKTSSSSDPSSVS
jgi:hypothetical protein